MKIKIGLIVVSLLLIACKEKKNPDSALIKRTLECTPDTLYAGDTLRIRMSKQHGNDLALIDPSGNFYFISESQAIESLKFYSLIPNEKFKNMTFVNVITNETKITPYIYGKKEREIVFKETGCYEIRLSNNLRTEVVDELLVDSVFYFHEFK